MEKFKMCQSFVALDKESNARKANWRVFYD